MNKVFGFISHLFGFERLSQYENDYLHDANIRSCSYMGFIVVMLEVWMLVRQTYSKIIPKYQAGGDLFALFVKYTSKYWLFLLIGLGLMLFCLFYQRDQKLSKGKFITLFSIGTACVLYTAVLKLESFTKAGDSITPVMASIMNAMLILVYVFLFVIGASIVTYVLFKYLKNKNIVVLEHVAIIAFTLVCLAFGIFVSYSDFWGGKEIICFLTMVLYVGCLLIYRPYVTILILGACFMGFYKILLTYQGGLTFQKQDIVISGVTQKIISGDSVNYVTFFISERSQKIKRAGEKRKGRSAHRPVQLQLFLGAGRGQDTESQRGFRRERPPVHRRPQLQGLQRSERLRGGRQVPGQVRGVSVGYLSRFAVRAAGRRSFRRDDKNGRPVG